MKKAPISVAELASIAALSLCLTATVSAEDAPIRQLLWGDTHLHTKLSGDAYAMGNHSISPDDAYRYAKGYPVLHPTSKARIRINTPLDFLVVADHAEYMGVMQLVETEDQQLAETEIGRWLIKNAKDNQSQKSFIRLGASLNTDEPINELLTAGIRRPVWKQIIDAAEKHNQPGKFSAIIGWEWSSVPNGSNLHRVVFTPDGGEQARQLLPFSSLEDNRPEGLWNWLSETSDRLDMRFVAIPHNSNLSTGLMFSQTMSDGAPINQGYAHTRMKWEPVVEILQIKGSSETHPILSPKDEFAGHEIYEFLLDFAGTNEGVAPGRGDYWRSALGRGLEIDAKIGANPFKMGAIGATDSHSGLATAEENNFHGKFGYDAMPANKFEAVGGRRHGRRAGVDFAAQGLAGVWAAENTRNAIYNAFQRKEVYATSGPRIKLRFFGGWDFKARDAKRKNLAEIGYKKGVPMGGDLTKPTKDRAPAFLITAVYDPDSAYLDRIQIIKGWTDATGAAHEKIFNVALSGERTIDANGAAVPVGNTIDQERASYSNAIGAPELSIVWRDPEFDRDARAFYYARVLEIPTPRHAFYDAVALGIDYPEDYPASVQERAISSPIWYTP